MNDHTTHPTFIELPKKAENLTGQRFGRLIAIGPIGRKNRRMVWLCQCDCGNTAEITQDSLRNKRTKSCGCFKTETTSRVRTTHGQTRTPLYWIWQAMIKRCTKPKAKDYPRYGGRGITVCNEWISSFASFHDHVTNLPNYGKEKYSLDRIDNSLGYFPGNVRWASLETQAGNSRNAHSLTYNGKTQSLAEWERETGISQYALSQRIRCLGWSVEKTLTTPVQKRRKPNPDSYPRR